LYFCENFPFGIRFGSRSQLNEYPETLVDVTINHLKKLRFLAVGFENTKKFAKTWAKTNILTKAKTFCEHFCENKNFSFKFWQKLNFFAKTEAFCKNQPGSIIFFAYTSAKTRTFAKTFPKTKIFVRSFRGSKNFCKKNSQNFA
jgi:hypothetical protein